MLSAHAPIYTHTQCTSAVTLSCKATVCNLKIQHKAIPAHLNPSDPTFFYFLMVIFPLPPAQALIFINAKEKYFQELNWLSCFSACWQSHVIAALGPIHEVQGPVDELSLGHPIIISIHLIITAKTNKWIITMSLSYYIFSTSVLSPCLFLSLSLLLLTCSFFLHFISSFFTICRQIAIEVYKWRKSKIIRVCHVDENVTRVTDIKINLKFTAAWPLVSLLKHNIAKL